ncbi:histidine phosphatase family protein [Eubacteriales bacterium OttesenSCG-928-K08]|nr:histidine phosphatase family protein [Eubacteriales bacterium OttesenSCG-928-K08]
MRLILIRHGQTEWNTLRKTQGLTDIPLDKKGVLQAQMLQSRLADEQINACYTSPLVRASETAKIIVAPHGIPVTQSYDLIERDFGAWEGLTIAELYEQYAGDMELWKKDPFACTPPRAENLRAVQKRCVNFISEIKQKHEKETVLVVSHSVPLRVMVAGLIGLKDECLHNIEIDNAAYSEIVCKSQRNVLRMLNCSSHLDGKDQP